MVKKLEGRVAIVTGAGRGIGRAIAIKLATEGARVVATDLDAGPLADTGTRLAELGEVMTIVGDVTADDFGGRIVAGALEKFEGIDIVVNNAGYIWNTTIQKTSDEQWAAMLDVHMTAPFRILRAATGFFKEAARREAEIGRGRNRKVVNISSVSGTHGAATQVAYASAKAGLVGMTKTLAKEWGRYRVNVNAVAFGFIETRLTQEIPPEGASIEVQDREYKVGLPKALRESLNERIPLRRAGTPEDAAGAVYLLCLPESDYITGEVLECSGGGGAL